MDIIRSLFQRRHATEREFQKIMQACSARMLELVQSVVSYQMEPQGIDRMLLDYLAVESCAVEEFLDLANAQGNRYWYSYRRAVAFLKNFSQICHILISVQENTHRWELLEVPEKFAADTEECLQNLRELLLAGCNYCILEAQKHHIYKEMPLVALAAAATGSPISMKQTVILPMTRRVRHETKPSLTVIALATKFLRLSERNSLLDIYTQSETVPSLLDLSPKIFTEEDVRLMQTHFHNMQSMYDTFVYGSDISSQNPNINVLYNHISLILSLLDSATLCVHYYQRHVHQKISSCLLQELEIPNGMEILDKVVTYSLSYADYFRKVARNLCQDMLKQYAELGSITVNVPNYRGFHVRPSTLIAKIVAHYGSDVTMKLDNVSYDAKMPLELFRANEELNAQKRRQIFSLLTQNEIIYQHEEMPQTFEQKRQMARDVILDMFEKKQLVVYDTDFSFSDISDMENESYFEFVKRVMIRYMAMGKMDAQIDASVTFEGDKRVLQDIKILAENSYGEDIYGNNIVLPPELSYLRK